jgi:hypothetical protein
VSLLRRRLVSDLGACKRAPCGGLFVQPCWGQVVAVAAPPILSVVVVGVSIHAHPGFIIPVLRMLHGEHAATPEVSVVMACALFARGPVR